MIFETPDHEKSIQKGDMPDGLKEDTASGYCPASDSNMVKAYRQALPHA